MELVNGPFDDQGFLLYICIFSFSCERTAPRPVSEASVCTRKGRSKFELHRTGEDVMAFFRVLKGVSAASVHRTLSGPPFLVISKRGGATEEKLGTNHQ